MSVHMHRQWETVPADDLIQHPDNPSNGDIEAIAESLKTNGCYRPVYVSRTTGHILAGHHLYQALVGLGVQDIPVSWIDGLDREGELRILLGDNKIASLAMIDHGLELDLLEELQATEEGLMGSGYDEDDMAYLSEEQSHGFGPGGDVESLDDQIECPSCGHTFTRTITA